MHVAASQMNVRIPTEVKLAGDQAFLAEGLTPTEVVRSIWEKAARRGQDLQDVLNVVRGKTSAPVTANYFESASMEVTSQMRALGVDLSVVDEDQPSDSELLEMAYYEKADERGLL